MKNIWLGTILGAVALIGSGAIAAQAEETRSSDTGELCGNKPSCADMGFTRSADDCRGYFSLRCPWDKTKYYCQCHYEYKNRDSQGDPNSLSCKRFGQIYYKSPCPGVRANDCESGYTVGNKICTDTNGEDYYESCSENKPCEVGDLLYSDSLGRKACFPGIMQEHGDYTAVGVVFDDENNLAIALDENRGSSTDAFGDCDICGFDALGIAGYATHYAQCHGGVAFYRHCRLDDDSKKMKWLLSSFYYGGENSLASSATVSLLNNKGIKNNKTLGTVQSITADQLLLLLPAVAYCNNYSKKGAPGGAVSGDHIGLGSWMLPSPNDWKKLNRELILVNATLAAYGRTHSGVSIVADRDYSESDNNAGGNTSVYTDRQYWTPSVAGTEQNTDNKWITKHGFRTLKEASGPIIFDFDQGTTKSVPSTEPGVRARCMIRYVDTYWEEN